MCNILEVEFTQDEVFRALKQMYHTKTPGPNEMVPVFYQKYWDIMGREVTEVVLSTLHKYTPALTKSYVHHSYFQNENAKADH